jgi:allantoin racemase
VRLWHQSRTELGRLPAYEQCMAEHFARVADPGTVVDLHGLRPNTYVTDYPGMDTHYVYFSYLHSLQIFHNVQQAEREGYDGFLAMNLPEPVQQEAQTLVDIPVVSYAQASMYVAAMLGRRFAIVTMLPQMIPLYESHIDRYGMETRAWGVVPLGLDDASVFAGFDEPGPVVAQVEARARELAARGVDVLIPGEAPLSAVLGRAGLARVDDVPIVDALGATLKVGEALVRLAQVSGMRASTHGYFNARPPAGRRTEIERYYRLDEGAGEGPLRDERSVR